MSDLTQRHRLAAIGTPLEEDRLLLRRLQGHERISEPFLYRVEMASEDADIPFEELMGEQATIRLTDHDSTKVRYFNGIVADICQLEPEQGLNRYEATLVPWLWFLHKSSDCRIFQKKTIPEILTEVFKGHGFEDFEQRLSGSYPALEYCVQYRESDFNFVSRLMEEVGIYYFFVHENGKHTLILADSVAAHDPCSDYPALVYVGPDSPFSAANEVQRWEPFKKVTPGGFELLDFNFAEPKTEHKAEAEDPRPHSLSAFQQFEYEGEFTEDGGSEPAGKIQFEDLAKVRLQALQAEHRTARGESTCRGLILGHLFDLEGCYRQDQNGKHFIIEITHSIDLGEYLSTGRVPVDRFYTCAFLAIPADVDYRPPRRAPRPRVAGPQTAVVVGREGEEIDTDKFGRVKVLFHWDRDPDEPEDGKSSCWVRVAQNWAGKKWGAFFLPRVGHEVIVDFLEGDPDRPIITGRVYNGDNLPPYPLPDEKTKSTIKSSSTPDKDGHNELRFEDKKNSEQIYIHAEKDMDVRIKNNFRETNYGNRDVRVGWEKDGDRGGDYKILVRQDENVHIENDQFELVDNDSHLTIKGERTESFEKSKMTRVEEKAVLNTTDRIVEAGDSISHKTKEMFLQGAMAVHVKGMKIHVEGTNISLKSGPSFITISPAGVDISGPMVKINSGGSGQSATEPEAAPDIEVLEPFDAALASDSRSGGRGRGSGRSRVRGGGVLTPIRAPDYEPPPTPPPPRPPGPPPAPPEPERPCGIKALEVSCSHNERKAVGGRLLVVPSPSGNFSYAREIGRGDYAFGFEIAKKWGGSDLVSVKLIAEEPGEEQYAINTSPSAGRSSWNPGSSTSTSMESPETDDVWLKNFQPVGRYIFGKGCDDVIQQCEVFVFPSDSYEYSLKIAGFRKIINEVNEALKAIFQGSWGPVTITPSITGPSGQLKASHGWKEDSAGDKASYDLTFEASLSPIGGVTFDFRISLAEVAAAGSLSAIGIPPPIAQRIASTLTDYLADIFVGADVAITLGLAGSITRKAYFGGETANEGSAGPSVTGTVGVYLGASIGNPDILGAEIVGKGSTGLTASGAIKLDSSGVGLEFGLKCPGIEVSVSLTFQSFIWDKKDEFKWSPIPEFDVFGPKTIPLIEFNGD